MSFADLGVSNDVASALAQRGINQPFPVQKMVIRDALAGHDLLVQSPTGSGKTLAFGVPLVDRVEPDPNRLSALVLAPTRELASQIVDELGSISAARGLKRRRGLRRRRLRAAERRGEARRHRRRHPRPARGPARARRDLARAGRRARPRRGRPDARHGLQARRRPDRRADPGAAPDAVLLGDAGGRDRQDRRRLHQQRPLVTPTPADERAEGRHRAPLPPRRVAERQARPPGRAAARASAPAARWSSSAPSTAPTAWSSGCAGTEVEAAAMHGDKSQGQRERALARFESATSRR